MDKFEEKLLLELKSWEKEILKKPGLIDNFSKKIQNKLNNLIPKKIHKIIANSIKNFFIYIITGADILSTNYYEKNLNLLEKEKKLKEKFLFYQKSAVAIGIGTGYGGLLISLADFPLLLSIKIKFLYDALKIYGYDIHDYRERLFLLYIFQLAFSCPEKAKISFNIIKNWNNEVKKLPVNIDFFDWHTLQQEYRDYIDISKFFQFIPGIGAVFGGYANYKLMEKLYKTTKNAYRMRYLYEKINRGKNNDKK